MFPSAQRLGANYDRLVFHRGLLLWVHLVLAIAICLAYLSTLDLTQLRWSWRGWMGIAPLRAFGPMLPYLFSAVLSRRLVTQRRLALWIFIAILFAGTGVTGYWYMTDLVHEASLYRTLEVVLVQSCVYLMAAVLCFGRRREQ
jgi:hypothetical protein